MTTSFDSAISHLTNRMNSRGEGSEREELRQAIRVLEDWPKWEPLIEAAGRVDKEPCINALYDVSFLSCKKPPSDWILNRLQNIRALLESLPGKEEK
jgi:hypothetical protein